MAERITETPVHRPHQRRAARSLKNAAIHHREDPGGARTLGSSLVDHAVLQPQCGKLQLDAFIDDRRDMLRPAKHVHDVHMLTGPQNLGQMREIRHSHLAEHGLRGGRDRDDSIAKPL